jgi:hypothetical protein
VSQIKPIEILDLQPIVDRLSLLKRDGTLRDVQSAADAIAAASPGAVIASPSATVVYLGAAPYEVAEGSGPLRQAFEVSIGVVLGLTLAGARGAEGLKKMQAPAAYIRGALFGWQHPGAENKFRSAGESVEDFDEKTRTLFLRLDFTCRARIQES